MNTTRGTLLARVTERDEQAWSEFHDIYFKILRSYARRFNLSTEEAEDIAADCMTALLESLEGFMYDRSKGRFRAYLRKMVLNRVTKKLRRKRSEPNHDLLLTIKSQDAGPDELWERDWMQGHLEHCIQKIRFEFSPQQFEAFSLYAVRGWSPQEIASHLRITTNQVYLAKSRILKRLKSEMIELDEDLVRQLKAAS